MNVNSLIFNTLSPLGYPVKDNVYKGTAETYITFNYEDDRATEFEDNEPVIDTACLQIHLFCPSDFNYNTVKKQIRSRLFKAGFSYPRISSFYEDATNVNHIVFQCEIEGSSEMEE